MPATFKMIHDECADLKAENARLRAALVALDNAGLLRGEPDEYKQIADAKWLAREVLSETKEAGNAMPILRR